MNHSTPLHLAAKQLGFTSETDLAVVLRYVPGLPFQIRRGHVYTNTRAMAIELINRGFAVNEVSPDWDSDSADANEEEAQEDSRTGDDDDSGQPRRRR